MKRWLLQLIFVAFFISNIAQATTYKFVSEGVSDYSDLCGSNACDLFGAQHAYDMWNTLPSSLFDKTVSALWQNNNVYCSDFTDPSRISWGNDSASSPCWDAPGITLSYFSGHGQCPFTDGGPCSGGVNCPCTSSANCNAGQLCQIDATGAGMCSNRSETVIITSSTADDALTGHYAYYGFTHQYVALGEDSTHSWAGVGSVGGTRAAIIYNSCGAQPYFFPTTMKPMFAGAFIVQTTLVAVGDVFEISSGGYDYANIIAQNTNAAMYNSWISFMTTQSGGACPGNGGYNGFLGCGADLTLSYGESGTASNSRVQVSWAAMPTTSKPSAKTNYSYKMGCNYDCASFPMYNGLPH